MKGFPNQVADLLTLTKALRVIAELADSAGNPKDDGVLGEALIRREVLGTGHTAIPIEDYLAQQKAIPKASDRSYRTRARGLRQLFRTLGVIVEGATDTVTPVGRQIIALGENVSSPDGLRLWRNVILQMTHDGGDTESSHPYQVLLRLVAKRPGITRAKCALALEARDDSEAELERITALSDLDEAVIIERIGTTESNWENAKKVLPHFAEQLGDVRKVGQQFFLTDAPGSGDAQEEPTGAETTTATRKPKRASAVSASTIAKSGTAEEFDEEEEIADVQLDAGAIQRQKERLRDRLRRHNLMVQGVARALEAEQAELFENPFDCLARFPAEGLLVEVKTLDGTEADEIARVREALAQLLYYEAFVSQPLVEKRAVRKVACFELKISDAHVGWLEKAGINVIWCEGDGFNGTERAVDDLSGHFGF